jgi:hypothetical protein
MLGIFASELNLNKQRLAWVFGALYIIMCVIHPTEKDQHRLINQLFSNIKVHNCKVS